MTLRPVFLALAFGALSGCMNTGGGLSFTAAGGGSAAVKDVSVSTVRHADLARGSLHIKAPRGYCIDKNTLNSSLKGSSALLSSCSALHGKGSPIETSAVMMLTATPRRPDLKQGFGTQELATAVGPAKVIAQKQDGALALVQVATGGQAIFDPADPKHWRGAFVLDNRLILISLYAPEGGAMAGAKGADLLKALAAGVSAKRGSLLRPAAGRRPAPVAEEKTPRKKATGGFIGRLFKRS